MDEGVACSRCGATFDTQDELMVHSIDAHAGSESSVGRDRGQSPEPADLDDETVRRLVSAVESRRGASEDLLVRYRQRFLALGGGAILAVAVGLSYLHLTGVLDTAVYMFSLGTLFGLTLSYLQAFVQDLRR